MQEEEEIFVQEETTVAVPVADLLHTLQEYEYEYSQRQAK